MKAKKAIHPDGNDCCCDECGARFVREHKPWMYQMPDDRNRLIEEAREIIGQVEILFRELKIPADNLWRKRSRRWLKETKP